MKHKHAKSIHYCFYFHQTSQSFWKSEPFGFRHDLPYGSKKWSNLKWKSKFENENAIKQMLFLFQIMTQNTIWLKEHSILQFASHLISFSSPSMHILWHISNEKVCNGSISHRTFIKLPVSQNFQLQPVQSTGTFSFWKVNYLGEIHLALKDWSEIGQNCSVRKKDSEQNIPLIHFFSS